MNNASKERKLERLKHVAALISANPSDAEVARILKTSRQRVGQLKDEVFRAGLWNGERPDPVAEKYRHIRQMYVERGMTIIDMAEETKLPRASVIYILRKIGIQNDGRDIRFQAAKRTRVQDADLLAAWEKTGTLASCARAVKLRPSEINWRLDKMGVRTMGIKKRRPIEDVLAAICDSKSYAEAAEKLGMKEKTLMSYYVSRLRIPRPEWDNRRRRRSVSAEEKTR